MVNYLKTEILRFQSRDILLRLSSLKGSAFSASGYLVPTPHIRCIYINIYKDRALLFWITNQHVDYFDSLFLLLEYMYISDHKSEIKIQNETWDISLAIYCALIRQWPCLRYKVSEGGGGGGGRWKMAGRGLYIMYC